MPGDLDGRVALYRGLLADRRVLVLLDNIRSAEQVRPLLPNSPRCLVLITSRDRLDSLVVHEGAHRLNRDVLPYDDAVRVLACHIAADRMAAEPEAVRAPRRAVRAPAARAEHRRGARGEPARPAAQQAGRAAA